MIIFNYTLNFKKKNFKKKNCFNMLPLIHLNKYGFNKHYFENINQVRKSLTLLYI